MTVKELIEKLKQFDPEAFVCVKHHYKGWVQLNPCDMEQGTSAAQDDVPKEERDPILWIRPGG